MFRSIGSEVSLEREMSDQPNKAPEPTMTSATSPVVLSCASHNRGLRLMLTEIPMIIKKHSATAVALVSIMLISTPITCAADASPASATAQIPPERLELKVLRVFAAKDGEAIFRAYLVKWK